MHHLTALAPVLDTEGLELCTCIVKLRKSRNQQASSLHRTLTEHLFTIKSAIADQQLHCSSCRRMSSTLLTSSTKNSRHVL